MEGEGYCGIKWGTAAGTAGTAAATPTAAAATTAAAAVPAAKAAPAPAPAVQVARTAPHRLLDAADEELEPTR